jgi:hypothetical protein
MRGGALKASFQGLFRPFRAIWSRIDHALGKMKTSSGLGLSGTIGLAPRCFPIIDLWMEN